MWLFCLLDPGQIRYRAIYTPPPNQIPGYAAARLASRLSVLVRSLFQLIQYSKTWSHSISKVPVRICLASEHFGSLFFAQAYLLLFRLFAVAYSDKSDKQFLTTVTLVLFSEKLRENVSSLRLSTVIG